MAIDLPQTPQVDNTFTVGDTTWTFNEEGSWDALQTSTASGVETVATIVPNISDLPTSAPDGSFAYVTANNKVYLRVNGGWRSFASVAANTSPSITSQTSTTAFTWAATSTAETISIIGTDPENDTLTYTPTTTTNGTVTFSPNTPTQVTGGTGQVYTATWGSTESTDTLDVTVSDGTNTVSSSTFSFTRNPVMFNSTPQFFPASSVPWSYGSDNLSETSLTQQSETSGVFGDSSNAFLLRKFKSINATSVASGGSTLSDQGIVKYTFANGFTSPTIDSQVIGPELETSQNHYIRYPTSLSPNGLYIVSRNNNAPDRDFFLQKISDLNSTGLTVPSTSIPNPTTISSYQTYNNRENNKALWKSDSSAFYTMIVLNNSDIYIRINSVDSSGNVTALSLIHI